MARFEPLNPNVQGRTIFAYFGNSGTVGEGLTGAGTEWFFANTPIVSNMDDIRLLGSRSGVPFFIVNFEVEPLSGKLTVNSTDATGLTAITANYQSYLGLTQFVVSTGSFVPGFSTPTPRQDIGGMWHYTRKNTYPQNLNFNIIQNFDNIAFKLFASDAIVKSEQFLVIDLITRRTYEGFLTSPQMLTVQKGEDPLIPVTLFVQPFGKYDVDTDEIDWTADKN